MVIKSCDNTVLSVLNLSVVFKTENGQVTVVDDVSFKVKKKRTLGIVGESGCGKSVTALSILRLLPQPVSFIKKGRIIFDGIDITQNDISHMDKIRGNRISMIFQEPMTALNPVHKIGKQIEEVIHIHHRKKSFDTIRAESVAMLCKVGIPDPEKRVNEYPHQLSGGMRQRIMIAMALACGPELLIADEPTTALDVTIQMQILTLLKKLQDETGMAVIFITHDLGVIAEVCDEVVVMYAGKIVEMANVFDLFRTPLHPYTKGLLASIPRLENKRKTKLDAIKGMVPDLSALPKGCRFVNRCPAAVEICSRKIPELVLLGTDHYASCHLLRKDA